MPTSLTIRIDPSDVLDALEGVKNGVPRAATRAINRSLVTVRAAAARDVAEDIGWPVTLVRNAIAARNASYGNLEGSLEASGRRIPLIAFRATGPEPSYGRGPGVSYRIGRTGKVLPHAFIARMRSGHRGVFQRLPGARRLPIAERFGPSIPRVATREAIQARMRDVGGRAMEQNLLHEIEYLLSTRRGA